MFIGGCHEALCPAPSHLTNMGYDRKHRYGALRFWIRSLAQRPHLTNCGTDGRQRLAAQPKLIDALDAVRRSRLEINLILMDWRLPPNPARQDAGKCSFALPL
jgi:hypothetical protein